MGFKPGITIEGAREFRRTLKAAGDDLSDLKATNKEAAEIVKARAESWVPRKSGYLQSTLRTSGTQTTGIVRAGSNRKGKRYAPIVHWGWKARGIKPNPFLSYAAQATQPAWTKVYEKYFESVIDKMKGI